jgi:hypothetical protein
MEEVHKTHKDVPFGWVKWLKDLLAAQAQARHERAPRLWDETRQPASPLARPDRSYQMIRMAFGPRL